MTVGSTLPPVERRVLRQDILLGLRSGILNGEIPRRHAAARDPSRDRARGQPRTRSARRSASSSRRASSSSSRTAARSSWASARREIETIYAIRALLEERAFAKACRRRRRRPSWTPLAEMVEKMIAASEAGDVAAVAEHDMHFHGRVVELSGFSYLRRLWTSIDGVVRLRAARDAERPELADADSAREWLIEPSIEHRDLVDALRSRRPADRREGRPGPHHPRPRAPPRRGRADDRPDRGPGPDPPSVAHEASSGPASNVTRDSVVVRLEDSDGVVGWGETYLVPGAVEAAARDDRTGSSASDA